MKDLYKTLGVAEGADESAIKKAYRKLAKEYHPDVTGDDKKKTERFKEINEAYAVLGDAAEAQGIRSPQARAGAPRRHARRVRCRSVRAHVRRCARDRAAASSSAATSTSTTSSPACSAAAAAADAPPSRGAAARPRQSRGADVDRPAAGDLRRGRAGHQADACARAAAARWRSRCRPASKTADGCASPARAAAAPGAGGVPGDLYLDFDVRPDPHLRRAGDDIELDVPVTITRSGARRQGRGPDGGRAGDR